MGGRPEYSGEFFDDLTGPSTASARVIVPLLLDWTGARSVVDVGCGRGAWLRVFREQGVETIRGFDGDYVLPRDLMIPAEAFTARDLIQPLPVDRTYDLAVCLEVAEHLPAQRADGLVADLTQLAKIVAFSAAIPGQGGTRHINEQWPQYWIDRFAAHDYVVIDCIRARIVDRLDVAWWFRQNIVLFVEATTLQTHRRLAAERDAVKGRGWDWVHASIVQRERGLRALLKELPRATLRTVLNRAKALRAPNTPAR